MWSGITNNCDTIVNSKMECAICLSSSSFLETVIQLECKHSFHSSCIDKWFEVSKSCPLCRSVCEYQTHIQYYINIKNKKQIKKGFIRGPPDY